MRGTPDTNSEDTNHRHGDVIFRAITGHDPYPYQITMYEILVTGHRRSFVKIGNVVDPFCFIKMNLLASSDRKDVRTYLNICL